MNPGETRRLGRTEVEVTALGFGTTGIGNLFRAQSDHEAMAALNAAWDAGVRYFDTAPLYGFGRSEKRLGAAAASFPDRPVISTKVGRTLEPAEADAPSAFYIDPPPFRPRFDYSGAGVRRSFEESLDRLGVQSVDILLLHDLAVRNHGTEDRYQRHYQSFFDDGGYDTMLELRRTGRVRAIGVGVGEIAAAERLIEARDFDALLLAGRYTLMEQHALDRLLPLCEQKGVGVIIGGPYNSGILATGAIEGAMYDYRPAPPDILERVSRMEAVCRRHCVPLIAAALQFPLHHPAVASVIPGLSTREEVEAALATLETDVPSELYRELQRGGLLDPRAPIPA